MLAMVFLAVGHQLVTADERDRTPVPAGMIPFTLNEIRRLFDALTTAPPTTAEHVLNWSTWRRKHQAIARECHYRRRSEHL
jgi:hypothetical protein